MWTRSLRKREKTAHCTGMDSTLERLAEIQHGLVTNRQIDDCCATPWERRRLIDGGPLLKAAPGVYRVRGAPVTHEHRLVLGLLALGNESVVSYEAAAALHRLDRSDRTAVEFTVVRGGRQPMIPFQVHTTKWLPPIDRVSSDGFRATSATRTIIDLAHARRTRPRIEAAIDSAVRLGLSSPTVLAHRLETLRGSGRWGCRLIEDLVVDSGGHSPLERRFLQIVREAGLPRPATQVIHRHGSRFVARVDFLFGADVVVEVSGQHGHSSPSERRKDAQRRSELIEMGRLVYEHTYADVFETPQTVVRDLRRRLTSRLCPTS